MPEHWGCPQCGGTEFRAIEQVSAVTTCRFAYAEGGGIEIDIDPDGEFIKDDAHSSVVAYTCADEDCVHTFGASELDQLVRPD